MYTFERFYYFRPYRGKSNYWLNRYGEGAISSHQKATLYTATGAADQRLQVHKVDGGCQLISALSTDFKDETKMFGLNIYGRKAGSVCDFFPVYNNFDDALIDLLTVDAANSLYRIKLIKHDLYLTPASNANNAGLTWEVASGADNQVWQLCASQSSGGSVKESIDLPVHLSQKTHSEKWFRDSGCAVTAGIMAAAYHDNTIYNIHSFDGYVTNKDEQTIKIWTQSGGYSWYTPGGWEFLEDTEITTYPSDAETVAYIKSIIDSGIPPLCHCPGGRGHWMVAYDYTSGSTFEDILIVDPADGNQKTLAAGMRLSCDGTAQGITRIRKASSAH